MDKADKSRKQWSDTEHLSLALGEGKLRPLKSPKSHINIGDDSRKAFCVIIVYLLMALGGVSLIYLNSDDPDESVSKDVNLREYSALVPRRSRDARPHDEHRSICPVVLGKSSTQIRELEALTRNEMYISEKGYICLYNDCPTIHGLYIMKPLSEEESNFPIAYLIDSSDDVVRFEMFFKAVYRPQNAYCVSVDASATSRFIVALEAITECFPANVQLVVGGRTADGKTSNTCSEILLKNSKWKYMLTISLDRELFPLKSNREMVNFLQAMDGSSLLETRNGTIVIAGAEIEAYIETIRRNHRIALSILTRDAVYKVTRRNRLQSPPEFLKKLYATEKPINNHIYPSSMETDGVPEGLTGTTSDKDASSIVSLGWKPTYDLPDVCPASGKQCSFTILQDLFRRSELFVNLEQQKYTFIVKKCVDAIYFSRSSGKVS